MPDVAVLGVGRWGRLIVRDLVDLGAHVLAIDPKPDARRVAQELGAGAVASTLGPDRGCDGVVVATPASQHEADVLGLDPLGVPVACEKPLAVGSFAARRMVDRMGERLSVLHVWRYDPGVEQLGKLIRSGSLGRVSMVHTQRTNWTSPRTDVDPVWTLLPHDFSIGVEFFGAVPTPTSAAVEWLDGRAVGAMVQSVDHGSGTAFVSEVSTRHERRARRIRVHGHRGVAVLDSDERSLVLYSGTDVQPVAETLALPPGDALRRQLTAFLGRLDTGQPMKSNGHEGLDVVAAVERVLALGAPSDEGGSQ